MLTDKLAGLASRQHVHILHGLLQPRPQLVAPAIGSRLAHCEDFPQPHLQRRGRLLHQAEPQLLFRRTPLALAAASGLALAHGALGSVALGVGALLHTAKGLGQLDQFLGSPSSQRQELTPIFCQPLILQHLPIVAYFA